MVKGLVWTTVKRVKIKTNSMTLNDKLPVTQFMVPQFLFILLRKKIQYNR